MKKEICLQFNITDGEKAAAITAALRNNGIDFVTYDNGLYHLFKVKRSGRKWDEVMRIINAIRAPRYKKVYAEIENGVEYETIYI
jgi:hypothetical protein